MDFYLDEQDKYFLSIKELSKHVHNSDIFSAKGMNGGLGITISENLNKKNCRHSYYKDCLFDSTQCKSVGFAGSKFINTTFKACNFENGNLHSCDFQNVTFFGQKETAFKMVSVGFHKSTFTDCKFEELHIFSCGFTDVVFYNTIFKNCTIRLCSLENAQFINCYFVNTEMSTLNLEYVEFHNISAKQSVFPFITIPMAYGLLKQLPFLTEDNTIYSASNESHKLSISEYLACSDDFKIFYKNKGNYFALANIYLSQEQNENAYKAIEYGILNTIKTRDFRMMRHFCKLVYLNNIFTPLQRRLLYENISNWVIHENLSLAEYHNYQLFAGHIREMLINNNYEKPTLYFYLETNIEPNETHKQMVLLTVIDRVLAFCKVSSSSIELRHNSAYVDYLTVICESFSQLSQILIMIYGSLAGVALFASGIKNIVNSTQNMISNHDQHIINKLEQEKLQLEIADMKQESAYKQKQAEIEYQKTIAELEKLYLEIEEIEKESNIHREILLENGVKVFVSHSTQNLKSVPMDEILRYNQQH